MLKENPNFYKNILRQFFSRFIFNFKNISIKLAIFNLLGDLTKFYLIKDFKLSLFLRKKQHDYVYNFLMNKYFSLIEEYKYKEIKIEENNKKIWCLWWQGIENAPDLVKKCIKSINENSGKYELIFINKDNYSNYLDIPNEIIQKLKEGKITLTHFSDILRAGLLSSYGGIWVDSTMFFYENIFDEFNDVPFNTSFLGNGKWCSFFLGGNSNKLFYFLYDFFIHYNLEYDELIHHLLVDYGIEIAYNNFKECRNYIDNATLKNPKLFYLEDIFSETYNSKQFKKICKEGKFFKLSYKTNHKLRDNDGNLTNFGYFMEKL